MPQVRTLGYAGTLRMRARSPFDFRRTFWKPSRFVTGLEVHTVTDSWRTFRVGRSSYGVHARGEGPDHVVADVYTDDEWNRAARGAITRRLAHCYGLDEDPGGFLARAREVPALRGPLEALSGMRHSCPESPFETAVIALMLQNTGYGRSGQMVRVLLAHYGGLVRFAGVTLRTWFTPADVAGVAEESFRRVDRLGYRSEHLPRFVDFFAEHEAASHADAAGGEGAGIVALFRAVRGVGPYTASFVAGNAFRDPHALALDSWNRKLLARRLLGVDDAPAGLVRAHCAELFPGYEGLAALYMIEHECLARPFAPLLAGGELRSWNAGLEDGA